MVWVWVEDEAVFDIHDELLAAHGGAIGIRDKGVVQSALARPRNLAAYEQPDAADLAAEYVFGLAKNHGFVDGNKRTAWMAAVTFLDLNGVPIAFNFPDAEAMLIAVAEDQMTVTQVANWFKTRL